MAIITMPPAVVPTAASVFLRDFGSVLTPFLGGPEQRINRLGTRFGLRVTLPLKSTRDEALVVQSRLLRAREDRLRMAWPQPGLMIPNPGTPMVATSVTAGTMLPMAGLTPGFLIREGQFLSIVHGRRYIHMFSADATVNSDGTVNAGIWPMLRTPLSVGDIVEISEPTIEGLVSPGDELGWQIAVEQIASFSFTISEGA